jgi:hypothetical protein
MLRHSYFRLFLFLALTTLAALACDFLGEGIPAGRGGGPAGWAPPEEILNAIWGTSASDAFVVGYYPGEDSTVPRAGLVLHYDGVIWSRMMDPAATAPVEINGIWGSSSSDVFAVGASVPPGGSSATAPAILHYDGASWSTLTLTIASLPSGADALPLTAIWGTSAADVFAAGADWPALLHYDGAAWAALPSPPSSFGCAGGWGSSASDVFAVGDVIYHYDGAAWAAMTTPVAAPASWNAIWGSSPSDVYAVGSALAIAHYDGSVWSPAPAPVATGQALNGVWGSSPSDVFASGYRLNNHGFSQSLILHYDGADWSPVAGVATWDAPLGRIWGSGAANVFVVSDDLSYRSEDMLLHYDGSSWAEW